MKKTLICTASLSALVLALALSTTEACAAAAASTAKEIMKVLFKGPKSAMGTLKSATNAEQPDWPKIQKVTDSFLEHAEGLPQTEPPRGGKADYEKLSKLFALNAKTLDDTADAKDLQGVKAAMGKIGASCKACHNAHKPK